MTSPILRVEGLVKRYGDRVAVNGLSFDVLEGEIFGLLGPNGAGKTTTISMLATLLRPDGGHVTVCGHDVAKEPQRVKPLIGFVPQDLALYPTLSAWDNLAFFGEIYGLAGSTLKKHITSALETSGWPSAPATRSRPFRVV
jgi:ABC-2 type transport system ATP-binding protein